MISIIENIRSQMTRATDRDVFKHLETKYRYAIAKNSSTVDGFRTQEITRRVQEKYPIDKQLEILCNANPNEIALIKEYREYVSAEVDVLIATFEAELSDEM